MSDKNYWKSDNENGCKYQKLAVANAFHYTETTGKPVFLKGIPWTLVEEYLSNNNFEYDLSSVYDEPLKNGTLAYFVNVYKNGELYVKIRGIHGVGSVFIVKNNE